LATSAAVDCSSAFSQEKKGLIENEKRNTVFEVTFEGRIFFICRRSLKLTGAIDCCQKCSQFFQSFSYFSFESQRTSKADCPFKKFQ
jgi:hypothetical protein